MGDRAGHRAGKPISKGSERGRRGSLGALVAAAASCAAAVLPADAEGLPQSPEMCAPSGLAGGYCGDGGPAARARLAAPRDVAAIDGGGELVADSQNFVVRRVEGGTISTVAGLGIPGADRPPERPTSLEDVALSDPRGVAALPGGGFVVADAGLHAVLLVSGGVATTIFGGASATTAQPRLPVDVVSLGDGSVAVLDQAAGEVVQVRPNGPAVVLARGLRKPAQLAVADGTGSPLDRGLYVSEEDASPEQPDGGRVTAGDVVRVTPAGVNVVVAGPGAGGAAGGLRFDSVSGVAVAPDGSLLVADSGIVRAIAPDGRVTVVAGEGQPAGSPAAIGHAGGITVGAGGLLLIADPGNDRINRVVLKFAAGAGSAPVTAVAARSYGASSRGKRPKRPVAPGGLRPCSSARRLSRLTGRADAAGYRFTVRFNEGAGARATLVLRPLRSSKVAYKQRVKRLGTGFDVRIPRRLHGKRYTLELWVAFRARRDTACKRLGNVPP